ncbi:MAG: LysR family transcriptional regulator [Sphaerochaetaceae bacterium]|nr:LysR family transcriptional regulator [Sphaerochaetaceae bacterium]
MLRQIKYFQTIVHLGSFTEAAEECYISQSAISQQIQALEHELGVKLLNRQNRKFTLTPAGEYFYKKSLVLTADFEKLCRDTVKLANQDDFQLRIGYLACYGGYEFRLAVAEFAEKYPNIPVSIITGNHEDLYNALRLGGVDLVLNDQRRAFSDEYVNRLLTTSNCNIEIAARNPIADMEYVTAEELKDITCILVASQNQQETERTYYRDIVGIHGDFLFAENLEAARLMVVGGKGFLPIEGGEQPPQFGSSLRRIPLLREGKPIRRTYCAFWKADNSGYYIEDFADILKSKFTNGN